jgi:hypothetical protein
MSLRKVRLYTIALLGAAALLVGGNGNRGGAQEEAKPVKTERGGLLAQTDRHQFEVFFYPTGVRVFPSSRTGTPVDTAALSGTASFYHPNSPNLWFSQPLRPVEGAGGQPGSLDLAVGLAHAPATGARVAFHLSGLPDSAESTATFTVPLGFVTAQTVAPHGGAPAVPRYTYGPGYYGYGYYERTSPARHSRPSGVHNPVTTPGMFSGGEMIVGPYHRDWTTGRSSPIAKPWLRPMD